MDFSVVAFRASSLPQQALGRIQITTLIGQCDALPRRKVFCATLVAVLAAIGLVPVAR